MKTMAQNKINILYLSLNPNLQGPIPKIDPLLITALSNLECNIKKISWGRHAEEENLSNKLFGRTLDVIRAVINIIRLHPDILYIATTLNMNALLRDIPLLLVTYWFPPKKVLMMHGSQSCKLVRPGNKWFKLFTGLLIRLSDAILLLSTEEQKEWDKFFPNGKYYKVDNPFISIDPLKLCQISDFSKKGVPPKLLFVGRLTKTKGIFDLLDAMPNILSKVDCHLQIAGQGEDKDLIIQRIKQLNLNHAVTLLGYIDSINLSDVYKSSTIFVLPTFSDNEGLPTVIVEAMSFGLPIITTNTRGIRDHFQDGINAIIVQSRDPVSISIAVEKLLNNPGLCLKMSQANITKIKLFEPSCVALDYVQIFSKLLGR